MRTLVVDNGAYTIKAGFATSNATYSDCHVIPNCIARSRDRRVLVGAQLHTCRDFGGMQFRRPVEKGYLVNWEAEREIFDRSFIAKDAPLRCNPAETTLLLTEAPNAPVSLQSNTDQMVFEEFEFARYSRCVAPSLIPWLPLPTLFDPENTAPPTPTPACIIIDTGYSHTHTIPYLSSTPHNPSIRRLDIAGKFLTNYLKELVSLRSYNMMDETYIINSIKESVCFTSPNFARDLDAARKLPNGIAREYVLPDYNAGREGYVREVMEGKAKAKAEEQVMVLGNERFAVPELLLNPADIGLRQGGISEAVMQSVEMLPEELRGVCLANVVLTGGTARIPGLAERVEAELRGMAPGECEVRVRVVEEPEKAAWMGGVRWVQQGGVEWEKRVVTREEYFENGGAWAQRKMRGLEGGEVERVEKVSGRSHKKRRTES